ncbi:hypothetical protein GTA08_BOTSDO05111 [Neofusicoccum parvum]|uniref:Uncharacterized protein n=1 Tax=Neofusicoccum parvum TaxID=310453 RepID=A0ACB5RSM9_9PEZI|nr:hypothetical protein GTA08_BOTSDO05111 [Neofusicoccum parvum]
MSCSSESYPSAQQPTARPAEQESHPAMDLQFTPQMPQPAFPWSSPASSRRRTSSRTSSHSPASEDTSNSFRFVTATRPEEFRDPELMRTVRSHVMFGVVEGRQRRTFPVTSKAKAKASTRGESSGSGPSPLAHHPKRNISFNRSDSAATSNPDNPEIMERGEALDIFQRYRVPKQSSVTGSTPRSDQGTDADSPESLRPSHQSKRTKRSVNTPPSYEQQLPEQMLVQPPEGGRGWMNPLYNSAFQVLGPLEAFAVPTPNNPFSPHDPFQALPAPINADINMPMLKYYSPTKLTLMVQTEVFHLLNEAFNERWTRIKDTTIMSVVQLLCSELVNSGAEQLKFHETGLQQLIVERGGLNRLGVQGELAAVATAMIYSSAIFREGSPDPLFSDYANTIRTPVYSDKDVVPESPLFCPRARFFTLERSKRCNAATRELIQKLKQLADVAASPLEQSSWDTDQHKRSILAYIRALPAAAQLPAVSTELDRKARHRYEACRLAGLLYAESLVGRRPLSEVVGAGEGAVSLEALVEAIRRSDCPHSECWGDMTGVLYWVTLVGGAAARDAVERRWLTALNVRGNASFFSLLGLSFHMYFTTF